MAIMIWAPEKRAQHYTHIMAFQGCMMAEKDLEDFEAFMGVVGAKHPTIPIGCVQTKTDERWDFMFFVHDDDAKDWNFCATRLKYHMRWLSDVVDSENDYPRDFMTAYASHANK